MPKSTVLKTNKTRILTSLNNITEAKLPKIILKRDTNDNLSITFFSSHEDSNTIKYSASGML